MNILFQSRIFFVSSVQILEYSRARVLDRFFADRAQS